MSAATSPGTGLAYGLRRVCAAWGMARSSFYAMTSGQHAEQPTGKASGTEARDLGPGAAGGHRSRPGGIALVRVGDFWAFRVGQRRIQSVNTEPGVHGVRQPPRRTWRVAQSMMAISRKPR